jgi:C1A family cysteine protease
MATDHVHGSLATRPVQRFGWVPDLPDARDYLSSAPQAVLSKLPSKVDLRRRMPPVYDQEQLGSCTANAIAAAFEFDQTAQRQPDFMPSRLFYYNERAIEGTVESDSGAMIRDGIKSVAKVGGVLSPGSRSHVS